VSANFHRVSTTTRKTAEERRDEILTAARAEFAQHGLHGASTDAIARKAGVSQPYLFRLFGTKKELFLAGAQRCFDQTHAAFEQAAAGKHGREALEAMGNAYFDLVERDPDLLRAQMQGYASCDDPEVRQFMRAGYGRLVELVERNGASPEELWHFFANGMLFNVLTMLDVHDGPPAWAARLVEGCVPAGEGR
jgi:AcrR family transcriptional regulator